MIVVDSNILAYFYLPSAHSEAVDRLLAGDPEWVAPLIWRSELRNVLATHVRVRKLSLEDACRIQVEAEALMNNKEFEVDSEEVLRLAHASGCTAYDCEFIALAQHLGVKLVTMDAKLIKAFPSVAVTL